MSDPKETKTIAGITIEIPAIEDYREAIVFMLSGFMFCITNDPKKTLYVILALSLIIWQSLTNFELLSKAYELAAGVGG